MYDGKATDLPTANPALMSSCLHLFPVTNFFCFSHIDNHTHRLIVSEIIPYPVKKHDHLVTHSKNGTQMDYQPHNLSQPALHLHFTKFRNSTVTSYCRHRAPNTSATTYQRWVHVPIVTPVTPLTQIKVRVAISVPSSSITLWSR